MEHQNTRSALALVYGDTSEIEDYRTHYRNMIQAELDRRIHQNKYYSLRAFARDLGVSPSRISEVLSCKQGLSRKVAQRFAEKMRLSPSDAARFVELVTACHARSPRDRVEAQRKLERLDLGNESRLRLNLELDLDMNFDTDISAFESTQANHEVATAMACHS